MHSWETLGPLRFTHGGSVTTAFLDLAKADLRAAAQYVCGLPYGRNSYPDDPLIVIAEQRGTCSTKHALLRRLAIEQGFDLALCLGIYEMTERNTPGVGPVLQQHGLMCLPEAHCYLRSENKRIDVTRPASQGQSEPILHFLHEEEIDPKQITSYKTAVHRRFLEKWIVNKGGMGGLALEEVWNIREECILRLGV
jgi:hypothetical protein